MIVLNQVFKLGWEKFLWCNSFGLLTVFKTACLDPIFKETVRKKDGHSPMVWLGGDILLHVFPVFFMAWVMVQKGRRIPQFYGCLSLLFQHYYSFSQGMLLWYLY